MDDKANAAGATEEYYGIIPTERGTLERAQREIEDLSQENGWLRQKADAYDVLVTAIRSMSRQTNGLVAASPHHTLGLIRDRLRMLAKQEEVEKASAALKAQVAASRGSIVGEDATAKEILDSLKARGVDDSVFLDPADVLTTTGTKFFVGGEGNLRAAHGLPPLSVPTDPDSPRVPPRMSPVIVDQALGHDAPATDIRYTEPARGPIPQI